MPIMNRMFNPYCINHKQDIIITNRIRTARVDLKAIGRRLREIRGFDLSQAKFGKLLGIPQNTLSKYERGHAAPTLDLLVRLKAHSGKSIDWIVMGED